MPPVSSTLADAILFLHAAVVCFNVAALPVIWIGYFRRWGFVRHFYFRISHLLLIGVVAAESLLGIICPLTVWEDALRGNGGMGHENGFIAYWVHRLLFYDAPEWVFTTAYVLFFVLVAATWYCVRPQRPRWLRA